MLTVPTKITENEYKTAMYAVDRDDNIWLLWGESEDNHLYLGNDRNEWRNMLEFVGHDNCEVAEILVTDGHGCKVYVEAITCPIKLCSNQLDLKKLEEGIVEWY